LIRPAKSAPEKPVVLFAQAIQSSLLMANYCEVATDASCGESTESYKEWAPFVFETPSNKIH